MRVLEKRLGFRVQEYGLRQMFPRVPDHPALRGLQEQHLRDWQGEATLVPPRREYELDDVLGPTIVRSGIKVPRAWRVGNRGNVASVIIEKPAAGDFLSIVDGGFGLQYSALMEYREGAGAIVFCQMDVTGRSAEDPAASRLFANLLTHVAAIEAAPSRPVAYSGDAAGLRHLQSAGHDVLGYAAVHPEGHVLVLGPGSVTNLPGARALEGWLEYGGRVLAMGVGADELARLLTDPVESRHSEHVAAAFDAPPAASPFAGIGPGETHIREPRALDLIAGDEAFAGGLLAAYGDRVVLCQVSPWQFDYEGQFNLKMPFRRTSATARPSSVGNARTSEPSAGTDLASLTTRAPWTRCAESTRFSTMPMVRRLSIRWATSS